MSDAYKIGYWITSVLTFFICWIYAIASYGFFLGLGLGWIPSIVIAVIVGALWPLAVLAVLGLIIIVCIALSRSH